MDRSRRGMPEITPAASLETELYPSQIILPTAPPNDSSIRRTLEMYRQILIAPEDRKYQRIVWRDNLNNPITTFELNTVTYGTACAPFIAVRCVQQIAVENKEKYPDAYPVIIHDFYMDDMLTGADTAEEVVKIRQQVTSVLADGQFELRKWAANSETMIPVESSVEISDSQSGLINFDKSCEAKTLGIYWNCKSDLLKYEVMQTRSTSEALTKRKILSVVAKIFDPLNLLGPVTIETAHHRCTGRWAE
ncbi:hypothetical protein MTP99_007013 [Tenebrio molitor]|nr:hypothetical protein MTP99_007013 [Tenebrio molitor]